MSILTSNNHRQEIFGIDHTTLRAIAVARSCGRFSVYNVFDSGSSTAGRTERSKVPAITNPGTAVLTKADAQCPAVKTDLIPIEQILVGDRVLAESPTGEEDTAFGSEIIPSDWRMLTLRAPTRDGTVAEVVMLRAHAWLNEQHGEVGSTTLICVPECGINGNANALAIEPCREIPKVAISLLKMRLDLSRRFYNAFFLQAAPRPSWEARVRE